MRQPDIFQTPPLNETLSHSNGKVVFDHGPNNPIDNREERVSNKRKDVLIKRKWIPSFLKCGCRGGRNLGTISITTTRNYKDYD